MKLRLLTLLSCITFLALSGFANAQDRWLGFYESATDKILLHVEPKDAEGLFTGRLLFENIVAPIKAMTLLGTMTGAFVHNGVERHFGLYRVEQIWYFTVDDVEYRLQKVPHAQFPNPNQVTVATPARPGSAPTVTSPPPSSGPVAGFSKTLKDPGGTFTVNIPDGWQSKLQDDVYVLTKAGETTEIRIDAHHYSDRQQLLKEGNGEEFEDTFNYIKMTSQPYGTQHVRTTSQGKTKGRNVVIETLALYSPHGGGALIGAIIYDKNRVPEYFSLIEQIAQTVVFEKPAEDNTWMNRMRGKQLLYLKSISGGSTKYYYNLYSNGRYDYVYTYTYNSSGFYGADNDRDQGTWRVVNRGAKAMLILIGNKHGQKELVLEQSSASNELTVDGERFFLKAID